MGGHPEITSICLTLACKLATLTSSKLLLPTYKPFTHLAWQWDNPEQMESEKTVKFLLRSEVGHFFKLWDNKNVKFVLFIPGSEIQPAYARLAVSFTASATFCQVPYFHSYAK